MIKIKIFIFINSIFLTFFLFSVKNNLPYKIIKPVDPKALKSIIEEVNANCTELHEDMMIDVWFRKINCYLVDINNNGKEKYVFIIEFYRYGTEYWLSVFSKENGKIKYIKHPDSFCDYDNYYNPVSKEDEIFIEAQNTVYMRNIYGNLIIWKNNTCEYAFDKFCLDDQIKIFNQLYKEKNYRQAYNLLSHFEKKISKKIPHQKDLWLKNDIALAAIKSKIYLKEADDYLKEIKKSKEYKNASPVLIKAVETNQKLYNEVIKNIELEKINGTKGKRDYSWLLDLTTQNDEIISRSSNFRENLYSILADIAINHCSHDFFYEYFVHCKINKVDDRNIIIIGSWITEYRESDCNYYGFLICDLIDKTSILATFTIDNSCDDEDVSIKEIDIYSRSFLVNELPEKYIDLFCNEYKTFLKNTKIKDVTITFHDNWENKYDIKLLPYYTGTIL